MTFKVKGWGKPKYGGLMFGAAYIHYFNDLAFPLCGRSDEILMTIHATSTTCPDCLLILWVLHRYTHTHSVPMRKIVR